MRFLYLLFLLPISASTFGATMSFDRTKYVSTTGSDAVSVVGSSNAPFATVTNAVRALGGIGTVIVRGGNYFNQSGVDLDGVQNIRILSFPGETPNFYFGEFIPSSSFSAVSNGIFSATMPAAFAANLNYLSNLWATWPTRCVLLYQTNQPYGTNDMSLDYMPMNNGSFQRTNRSEHTPLALTNSLSNMTNRNGFYFVQGSTLYVKFAVSNVAGGLYIPSTNESHCFVRGGNPETECKLRGIKTHFAWIGYDVTDMGSFDATQCSAVGSGRGAFFGGPGFRGDVKMYHCEGYLSELSGYQFGNPNDVGNSMPASVVSIGGYWHDNNEFACGAHGNTVRTEIASQAYGGLGGFGWVDDGSATIFVGCTSYSNIVSGWQIGNAATFVPSYQRIIASSMNGDTAAHRVNDRNSALFVQQCVLDSWQAQINVAENPTTHFVQSLQNTIAGTYTAGNLNGEIIQGAGTTDQTRFPVSAWGFGATYSPLIANSYRMAAGAAAPFFGGPSVYVLGGGANVELYNNGGANFAGGVVTNNTVVWHSTNATPTFAYPNGSIATVTDGRFYVRTNGAWVQK